MVTQTRQRKIKEKSDAKVEDESQRDSPEPQLQSKKEKKSRIARLKENQGKGINRYFMTACKVILAVMVIPPFLNYAALQRGRKDYYTGPCIINDKISRIARLKENQGKGINRYFMTACKVILAVMVIPPFLKYAALQREEGLLHWAIIARLKENQGKGINRYFMTLCKVILAVMVIPPFLNYAALQREEALLKPDGEVYDIGWGQKLFLSCKGKGAPTVILDAPTGMNSDVWSLVVDRVAQYSHVCTYDRAGLGYSERPMQNRSTEDGDDANSNYRNRWVPFTAERMVEDLHQLVTRSSDQPKPFLLVGAELGALVAQFYAHMFDSDVMGLVLINPLTEDLFRQDKGVWLMNWFGHMTPSYQTLQLGAALGVTRFSIMLGLLQHPMYMADGISEDTEKRQKFLMCNPRHLSSVVDEHHFINETFSQFRTAKMIRAIPSNVSITVITGNYYDEQMPGPLNKAWAKSVQNLITDQYPHSQHIVVNGADRHMMYQNPGAIVEPIRKAIKAWRAKNSPTQDS